MDYFSKGDSNIFKLEIDENAKGNFLEMVRWTKFLAILGFILVSIALLIGLVLGFFAFGTSMFDNIASTMSPKTLSVGMIFLGGIYIYPAIALLQYSNGIKAAMNTDNKERFNRAIRHLKNMFKYMGILMICILGFYGIEIILLVMRGINR